MKRREKKRKKKKWRKKKNHWRKRELVLKQLVLFQEGIEGWDQVVMHKWNKVERRRKRTHFRFQGARFWILICQKALCLEILGRVGRRIRQKEEPKRRYKGG